MPTPPFRDQPAADTSTPPLGLSSDEQDHLVGKYRLTGSLGESRWTRSWSGERADGHDDREVVVEVLSDAADLRISRRFRDLRQQLARLEHPAIPRLLDAGEDASGNPFLVVERARGMPLDRFCDQERLAVSRRVGRILEVARACHHAHRRLVLHGDLEPSSTLVNDEGRLRILGFGRHALGSLAEEHDGSKDRENHEPEGASPASVAADVVSLGRLLETLLVGRSFDPAGDDPAPGPGPTPCHWFTQLPASGRQELARARETSPKRLLRSVRGDLEAIILAARRTSQERPQSAASSSTEGPTYSSAQAFAEDLERYLEHRPVQARPASWAIRLRKGLARHPVFAATSLAVLALGASHLGRIREHNEILAVERDRARAETVKATEIHSFLIDLLERADPGHDLGRELTIREVLDQGASRLAGSLENQPEVRAEMLGTIGHIYRTLGLFDQAETHLVAAVDLAEDLGGDASLLGRLAGLRHDQGQTDASIDLYREALVLARRDAPADEILRATLLSGLGSAMTSARQQGAERILDEALDLWQAHSGTHREELAEAFADLAILARNEARMEESLAFYREAMTLREVLSAEASARGEPSAQLIGVQEELGSLLGELGRGEEGIELLRRALDGRRRVYGPEHPLTARSLVMIAHTLRNEGLLEEAEVHLREGLRIREATLQPDDWLLAQTLNALGLLLEAQERFPEAEEQLRRALAIYPPDHPRRDATAFNLASVLRARGEFAQAARHFERLLEKSRRARGNQHWSVGHSLIELGLTYFQAGLVARAIPPLEESVGVYAAIYSDDSLQVARARSVLARVLLAEGRIAETEAEVERALAIQLEAQREGKRDLAFTRTVLGHLRLEQGRVEEARAFADKAAEVLGDRRDVFGDETRALLRQLGEG